MFLCWIVILLQVGPYLPSVCRSQSFVLKHFHSLRNKYTMSTSAPWKTPQLKYVILFVKKPHLARTNQKVFGNFSADSNIKMTTRFFYITKLRFDLLIKTFLKNQCFINKIFLKTFLILAIFGNFRIKFEENLFADILFLI